MENNPSFIKRLENLFELNTIVRNLERFQNFIVILLCIGLFFVMLIRLGEMFISLLEPLNFQTITSDILFILILVELFRLLIIYLQEQRISIQSTVQVSLVSALREILLEGVVEIPTDKLLGICAFLIVLGGLLFLRLLMFERFNSVEKTDDKSEYNDNDFQNNSLAVKNIP
ncbi:MAG: phosphate-starvation-inducible PsiE family protein [Rivularia sp. (in: Bacteria)]|nr:phosphate-starvation-inducible PsiE family protein [Rivularia sp. MS3]